MFIRIVAPHFCAAILDGEPAPILRYMRGWNLPSIRRYCVKKNWKLEILKEDNKNMAEHIRGTIQYVPKPREFIKGNKVTEYYSFKVNDIYYSCGSTVPPSEGNLVEFDAEKNAKGYWDVTRAGVRVLQDEEPTQAVASQAVRAASNSTMSKDDYWRRKEDRDAAKEVEWIAKDKRIELQSCRNSAIELVKILVSPNAGGESFIKIPAQAKREAFVAALVDNYTQIFVSENNKKNVQNEENPVEAPADDSSDIGSDGAVWDA